MDAWWMPYLFSVLTLFAGWLIRGWYDKRNVLNEHKRDALKQALAWMLPMSLAYLKAESAAGQYALGRLDKEGLLLRWPSDLHDKLGNMDLEGHLVQFLPNGVYRRGVEILAGFDRLYYETSAINDAGMERFIEVGAWCQDLKAKIESLKEDLEKAYQKAI